MIKRLIYRLFEHRLYWREVTFSEMAELYASRLLRALAFSMVGVFIAVFLYQSGYSLTFIMVYFMAYFAFRAVVAFPLARLVAWVGPKHATMVSNFLYVPGLILFTVLPTYGIWALAGAGIFQALSVTLYEIAYLVDFSKVKHDDFTGKELGYMHTLDQIAKGMSPVIGGFVAYWFGPQTTLIIAAIVFALAATPLFFTPEPVQTRQRILYRGLPLRKLWRNLVAEMAIGVDFVASSATWSLFVGIVVFSTSSNAIYAQLGVLSSLTIVVGVVVARVFGVLVDRHRSRELLRSGVALDTLTHLLRPFAATPFGVVMVNVINETATTAYTMPYTKALFAQADDLPGYRIAYFSLISSTVAIGAALMSGFVAVLSLYLDEVPALQTGFGFAGLAVLVIIANGLPALKKRSLFHK